MTEIPIHGYCHPRFSAVRDIFISNFEDGLDVGASACLIVDGETVVDLWGGWFDADHTREWAEDTIVKVHSTSKTMVALCALILIDRGLVDPYAPVATYWPEFAANGKENIQVRHIMSHTSGLSGWAQPVTSDDVYDWDIATSKLAAQEPWWTPGSASGYHLLSYNHLVGELVRRVAGIPMVEFFAREVAEPLGLDYHFGVSPAIADRTTPMIMSESPALDWASLDPQGVMMKTFTGPLMTDYNTSPARQAAPLPMNGVTNARSIARAQAAISHGGEFEGVRLLSPSTIDRIFDAQSNGTDLVLGLPVSFGIGFALSSDGWPYTPHGRTCWWAGMGGSRIINSVDNRTTFGYAMNKMQPALIGDSRSDNLFATAMKVIES